ncbi:MAG TPA: hypothetical protein VJ770_14635 [Stellaceae bacterium]|nr:hypothetical protein [Stellaceae bacterium]
MRKVICLPVLAALVGTIVIADNSSNAQDQSPRLNAPPTPHVGDTFTYNWDGDTVVFTYTGPSYSEYCYSAKTSNGTFNVCRTAYGNVLGGWVPRAFNPWFGYIVFPLFVGQHWSFSYRGDPEYPGDTNVPAHITSNYEVEGQVTSYEKITVPAGTFDAFKIEEMDQPWGDFKYKTCYIYYALKIGFIKFDSTGTMGIFHHYQLTTYSQAK